MSNTSPRRELSPEEKQILADVNQALFSSFKQHKKSLYNSLMRCGITSTSHELYYQCTDAVLQKERKAEERMREQLATYEKDYLAKLSKCSKSDWNCISSMQGKMHRDLLDIFSRFYSTTPN